MSKRKKHIRVYHTFECLKKSKIILFFIMGHIIYSYLWSRTVRWSAVTKYVSCNFFFKLWVECDFFCTFCIYYTYSYALSHTPSHSLSTHFFPDCDMANSNASNFNDFRLSIIVLLFTTL